jgi:hypothetical protein
MGRYRRSARFGLMHMVATNLCEWLYVLVEETKHEIVHLAHYNTSSHSDDHPSDNNTLSRAARAASVGGGDVLEDACQRSSIMGSLVQNASPYLFPCTIEYSLICAVILYEMWHNVPRVVAKKTHAGGKNAPPTRDMDHQFSVDCSGAHRGLFSGIILLVATIISLIMFFVLIKEPAHADAAVFQVTIFVFWFHKLQPNLNCFRLLSL